MTNFKKQFVSVLAASAVLLQVAAPIASADTTLTISGNGSDSNNTTTVTNTSSNTVLQSNTANVHNDVDANASTGGNSANKNTGGDVQVLSGDAKVTSTVANTLNSNVAQAGCNCGANGTGTVTVSGNGSDSRNNVELANGSNNQITQSNNAHVSNDVDAHATTGYNDANKNTGGTTQVFSGNATITSNVTTNANANVAQLGSSNGADNGNVSAIISGNGADSHNGVVLSSTDKNSIWQSNSAYIRNHVDAKATTGDNEAEKNTGGNTRVWSGDAAATANVLNNANFNTAALDCGCATSSVLAKIAGNGTDSDNYLTAALGSDNGVYQGGEQYGNHMDLANYVKPSAKTGYNEGNGNTGPVLTDPVWVYSGNANSSDSVTNTGNSNTFGQLTGMPTGFDFGGTHFSFNFNFGM